MLSSRDSAKRCTQIENSKYHLVNLTIWCRIKAASIGESTYWLSWLLSYTIIAAASGCISIVGDTVELRVLELLPLGR